MRLWVDDEREAPAGFEHAKTASEAIDILKNFEVEEISLDHDLGDHHVPEQTGNTVLLFIEKRVFTEPDYIPPTIKINTANTSARIKMEAGRRKIEQYAQGR